MSDVVNGEGTPRLMRIFGTRFGWIIGSSYDAGTGLTTLTTVHAHGMFEDQTVRIAGSAQAFDGDYAISSVPAPDQFTIETEVDISETEASYRTVGALYESSTGTVFTAASAQDPGQDISMIRPGHRISAELANGSLTFAKVVTVVSDTITVDEWTNGTPTNGTFFAIDGWVVDLPRTGDGGVVESFDPVMLVHELYDAEFGSRTETKFRGYKYSASLDYAAYIAGSVLRSLSVAFAVRGDDQLVLQPRKDAGFYYNVYFAKAIEMKKLPKGGYERMAFVFESKENIPSLPILSGYGSGYAMNYGMEL